MTRITYSPAPGEPEVTKTLGRTWLAGEAVEIEDGDPILGKLRGNPYFVEGDGETKTAEHDERVAKTEIELEKRIDGRTKEAREARAKAAVAEAEAAEKERQAAALESARGARSDAEERAIARQRSLENAKSDPDKDAA